MKRNEGNTEYHGLIVSSRLALVSTTTIRNWIRAGFLASTFIDGVQKIHESEIARVLEERVFPKHHSGYPAIAEGFALRILGRPLVRE